MSPTEISYHQTSMHLFFLEPTNETEIKLIIRELKASGRAGILPKYIKCV